MEIDEKNYLKDRAAYKVVTIKILEKTTIDNQKSIKSTVTMTIALMFHLMKITLILLLVQKTWAKPFTWSKFLKK